MSIYVINLSLFRREQANNNLELTYSNSKLLFEISAVEHLVEGNIWEKKSYLYMD